MKTAIISFTEKGKLLSLEISHILPNSNRFCFKSHSDDQAVTFENTSSIVKKIWESFDAIVFVCACGIAVRSIAPYIHSKLTDPAVIVIDDCGKFVISLLSGHIGGANELAMKIADSKGAQAVITTATDTGGLFSPDSFAATNDLIISNISAAKAIASAVLDGKKIGLISEYEIRNIPDELQYGREYRCGIYIGNNMDVQPFPVTLALIPKNIVLGIGCKKGTDKKTIAEAVENALTTAGIDITRVYAAASIDLKSNEYGLLKFCSDNGFEICFYTPSQLAEINGEFTSSAFVQSVTGVDNICERSAVKCSNGKLIMQKYAENGVTVAAAEKNVIIDFERKRI